MKLIYMAGPLFSEAERAFLERIVEALASASGLDPEVHFFLPHRDGKELSDRPDPREIFELDLRHLDAAQIVVGFLDGQDVDSGTCIELGYAQARGKKVFGIMTDFRATPEALERPNLMVWGVCEEGSTLFHDMESLCRGFAQYVDQHPILRS